MELKDKLYSKSSYLHGDKKDKYLSVVGEYLKIKGDMELIRTPISVEDIKTSLRESHESLEKTSNLEEKKQHFIDSIRLYMAFVSSGECAKYSKYIKDVLDERLLDGIYKKAAGLCSYTKYDVNLVVGLIRSYYDSTMMMVEDTMNSNLLDRNDIWAYETLEGNFLEERLDAVGAEELTRILSVSKGAKLSYIIALYNSSKILNQLLDIDVTLSMMDSTLDGADVVTKKLAEFVRQIKKGNHAIAYGNHKKDRLHTMSNELNSFNNLILNVSRR